MFTLGQRWPATPRNTCRVSANVRTALDMGGCTGRVFARTNLECAVSSLHFGFRKGHAAPTGAQRRGTNTVMTFSVTSYWLCHLRSGMPLSARHSAAGGAGQMRRHEHRMRSGQLIRIIRRLLLIEPVIFVATRACGIPAAGAHKSR